MQKRLKTGFTHCNCSVHWPKLTIARLQDVFWFVTRGDNTQKRLRENSWTLFSQGVPQLAQGTHTHSFLSAAHFRLFL